MRWRRARTLALAALGAGLAPTPTRAQGAVAPLMRGEVVAVLQASPRAGAGMGAGIELAVSAPIRVALEGTAGIVTGRPSRQTGRVDLVSRYLLDPYAQLGWGLSGGAGLTTQWDRGRAQVGLLLVGGIEGPARHGWRPAFEVALGQGARLVVALRRARVRGR